MTFSRRAFHTAAAGLLLMLLCALIQSMAWGTGAANHVQIEPPLVVLDQGKVRGTLRHGVLEFRGIPYGDDVSGDRRWTRAQPAQGWTGILDASTFQPACAQAARYGITESSANENCLHLNISRPWIPEETPTKAVKRPVLVWIHGGSFVGGSAALYRLDRLAREMDAVVVSINYRLGVLGFMPHPGFDVQYNGGYALEDQRLAMHWVKNNIAAFGGDPDNITLAGESAGAASVCMHLLVPEQTQDLFHKAIVQSAACSFALRSVNERNAFGRTVGETVGCTDPDHAVACMRQIPAEQLIQAGDKVAGSDLMAFAPVFGTTTLPRQGLDSLQNGQFVRVPVLYGGTRDEMRLWVGYAVQAGQTVTAENYTESLQAVYGNNTALIQRQYPAHMQGSPAATLGSVMSDFRPDNGINHCQFVDTAYLLSRHVPVYFMDFADRNAPVLGVSMPASPDPGFKLGAVHSSELNYFFPHFSNNSRLDAPDLQPSSQAMSEQMIAAWAQFMRTGTPQTNALPEWELFSVQGKAMRFIPDLPGLFSPAKEYQCDFWKRLYPAAFSNMQETQP